ncbi:MAG: hypothetical protein HY080_06270 [Gammaproteobacteria bacterium]|nr:hypothetical protein [Gammaproteobacteria bacterium]
MTNPVTMTMASAALHEQLRARVFLRAVLPLLETVSADQHRNPNKRTRQRLPQTVQIGSNAASVAARLMFVDDSVQVAQGSGPATLQFNFSDLGRLNNFFSGKAILPRLTGGLRHPLLLIKVLRLLSALKLLQPNSTPMDARERVLRVKLLLYLVSRGLAELHHGGHAAMRELVAQSPDRVYQWTVQREGIGAWLRMQHGKVKTGHGMYTARAPFVQFVFPDVEAAFTVLTASEGQINKVRDGLVVTLGSPEYTRKISLLMQQLDELLLEG